MAFLASIPEWFSTRRAAQVVAFFALRAGGQINVLKCTKLVYLADRLSMAERDYPITGDNFVSMDLGPVNTFTYSLMKGEASPGEKRDWAQFMGKRAGHVLPLASETISIGDLDELSRADIALLEKTWKQYKDVDRFDLAEFTHHFCPEWRDPHGSSIPIDFATVFQRLSKSDPIELAEEIQAARALVVELAGRSESNSR
jgi:uncharacterized phage-associated protein